MFQHTATRRWLLPDGWVSGDVAAVSTHSHPKVAARIFERLGIGYVVSTHSHPKVAA